MAQHQGSVEAEASIRGEDVVWHRPRLCKVSVSLGFIVYLSCSELVAWRRYGLLSGVRSIPAEPIVDLVRVDRGR